MADTAAPKPKGVLASIKKLPKWTYVVIPLGAAGLFYFYQKRKAASTASTGTTSTASSTTPTSDGSTSIPGLDQGYSGAGGGGGAGWYSPYASTSTTPSTVSSTTSPNPSAVTTTSTTTPTVTNPTNVGSANVTPTTSPTAGTQAATGVGTSVVSPSGVVSGATQNAIQSAANQLAIATGGQPSVLPYPNAVQTQSPTVTSAAQEQTFLANQAQILANQQTIANTQASNLAKLTGGNTSTTPAGVVTPTISPAVSTGVQNKLGSLSQNITGGQYGGQ